MNKKFSFSDFKKWISEQKDKPKKVTEDIVGSKIESKVSLNRLVKKIEENEGDKEELATDFSNNGGIVVDEDADHNLLVEVDSGSFLIPRFFVKKSK